MPAAPGYNRACGGLDPSEFRSNAMADQFKKRFDRLQDRKRRMAEDVVDPDAPPIPDEPVEQARADRTAGRNDPCPCGSGKKFKKCCGKAT
jgi:uncharacterized protein YecA (UPF0149 family)